MIFFYVLPSVTIKGDKVAYKVNDDHFSGWVEMIFRIKPIRVKRLLAPR